MKKLRLPALVLALVLLGGIWMVSRRQASPRPTIGIVPTAAQPSEMSSSHTLVAPDETPELRNKTETEAEALPFEATAREHEPEPVPDPIAFGTLRVELPEAIRNPYPFKQKIGWDNSFGETDEFNRVTRVESPEDGVFVFERVPASVPLSLELEPTNSWGGHPKLKFKRRFGDLALLESDPRMGERIVLEPNEDSYLKLDFGWMVRVHGTVSLASGIPALRAKVIADWDDPLRSNRSVATSRQDGSYELYLNHAIFPGSARELGVLAAFVDGGSRRGEGLRESVQETISISADLSEVELDLQLIALETISGMIQCSTENAAPFLVHARRASWTREQSLPYLGDSRVVFSRPDGYFRVHGLYPGEEYEILTVCSYHEDNQEVSAGFYRAGATNLQIERCPSERKFKLELSALRPKGVTPERVEYFVRPLWPTSGPHLQAGITLISSGPPAPRETAPPMLDVFDSNFCELLFRGRRFLGTESRLQRTYGEGWYEVTATLMSEQGVSLQSLTTGPRYGEGSLATNGKPALYQLEFDFR